MNNTEPKRSLRSTCLRQRQFFTICYMFSVLSHGNWFKKMPSCSISQSADALVFLWNIYELKSRLNFTILRCLARRVFIYSHVVKEDLTVSVENGSYRTDYKCTMAFTPACRRKIAKTLHVLKNNTLLSAFCSQSYCVKYRIGLY